VRIIHLNVHDSAGGAARAAYRLHRGLLAAGHDSRMLVMRKDTEDSEIIPFAPSRNLAVRLQRSLRRRLLLWDQKPLANRPPGSTWFSDDRSQYMAEVLHHLPPTDILHLHWISGFFDYRAFFSQLPLNLPVLWTLHDMNPFTGGCHFDGGCGKYLEQCGACPQIDSLERHDLSARVWQRKNSAFATRSASSIHVVTPSRWLAAEAGKSTLLSRFPVTVIPNGVDTERFQPRDRRFARQLFGIPPKARVVLFIADWAGEKRKGLDLLIEAIRGIEDLPELCVFTIGREMARQEIGKRSIAIEYIRDELTMSLAYSAADLFVVPSLQDNLPNTALEALACGIPTVAFAVGGLTDIIREDETGVLVAPADVRALRLAITKMLKNPDRLASMAESCRRTALAEYKLDVQARHYVALYKSLMLVRAGDHKT
jgi:glycosyltransferase involved in cell wall biosynthesis